MLAAFFVGYGQLKGGDAFWDSAGKAEAAAQKAVDFVNANMLAEGAEAELISASAESGVYKFNMRIDAEEFEAYLTKDGKIFFPSAIILESAEAESSSAETAMTCEDVAKSDKPVLEAFVVSECPFGVQMQRILNEIVKSVPQLAAYVKMEYMGAIEEGAVFSMHGETEAQENLRQICLREEQPDVLWNYIDCHIQEGNVDSCLVSAQADVAQLEGCLTDTGRGLAYAAQDFANEEKYGVTGSPTLILDGADISEFDFGGRTAEAVKTIICCALQTKPGFCDTTLNTETANTSFSFTYSSTESNAGSAAVCN